MMKLKSVSILIIVLLISGVAQADNWIDNWKINGIPIEKFKEANGRDWAVFSAGVLSSWTVHWLSHVAYFQMEGIDWHQEGTREQITSELTDNQRQWFGRSGFLGQLAVGGILKGIGMDGGYFGMGYHTGSFLEISTYSIIHPLDRYDGGDLGLLRKGGGNACAEYVAYTAASLYLLQPEYYPSDKD